MTLTFAHAGPDAPPRVLIIAELGVNHDGSLDRALSLVDHAATAGVDAVKLQLFTATGLLSRDALLAAYQEAAAADVHAMLAALQLPPAAMAKVRERAHQAGLGFIVTPFSLGDIEPVRALAVDAVKIASPDAVNTPLLSLAGTLDRPMLIATGTCDLAELHEAAEHARRTGGALLQCVSSYPTPIEHAALAGIAVMRTAFDVPVGYSDHTTEIHTGAMAVAAGACVLEKHLTYDTAARGPDHAASLMPEDLCTYVQQARAAATMLGPLTKRCQPIEETVRRVSRQSLVPRSDLPAGHVLTRDDLCIQRPGTGMPARQWSNVIGQILGHAVLAGHVLKESDLLVPLRESAIPSPDDETSNREPSV